MTISRSYTRNEKINISSIVRWREKSSQKSTQIIKTKRLNKSIHCQLPFWDRRHHLSVSANENRGIPNWFLRWFPYSVVTAMAQIEIPQTQSFSLWSRRLFCGLFQRDNLVSRLTEALRIILCPHNYDANNFLYGRTCLCKTRTAWPKWQRIWMVIVFGLLCLLKSENVMIHMD